MPHYLSDRERRYWVSAAAVVTAIYATAGLAGTLSGALRERGLLEPAFVLCFALLVAALLWSAVSRRATRTERWVILGVVVTYAMVLVRLGVTPEERTHLFEYGLVAVLVHQALMERARLGGHVRYPGLLAVVATTLLGWGDEAIQWLLPGRVYDIRDVAFNALAGLMAVAATSAIRWARRTDREGEGEGD